MLIIIIIVDINMAKSAAIAKRHIIFRANLFITLKPSDVFVVVEDVIEQHQDVALWPWHQAITIG